MIATCRKSSDSMSLSYFDYCPVNVVHIRESLITVTPTTTRNATVYAVVSCTIILCITLQQQ